MFFHKWTFACVRRGHPRNVIKRHREGSCDLKTSSLNKMAAKNGNSCKHGLAFPRRFIVAQSSKFVWIIQSFCKSNIKTVCLTGCIISLTPEDLCNHCFAGLHTNGRGAVTFFWLQRYILLWTKVVHIQFQFLTPRIVEKISPSDFLKALSSAAIVVT